MTPSSTSARPARRGRRALGTAGVAVAAAGMTTLASALLGAGPSPAMADPGDTYVATSTSQLVQSDDLESILVAMDTAKVLLNRDADFSSCLGEGNSWTQVLPGSPKPVSSTWTRRGHRSESLTESIAQAPTEAVAEQWEAILLKGGIQACRKPTYDFHYGSIHTDPVGSGTAHWAVSYRGTSKRGDGGAAVVRLGTSVGIVEVDGRWGPSWQTMESVAKVATDRLG